MVFTDYGITEASDMQRTRVKSSMQSRIRAATETLTRRPAPVPTAPPSSRLPLPSKRPMGTKCPPGMTVYAAGTRSEKCVPISCKMGQELVDGVCMWKKLPGVTLPSPPPPPPPTQQPSQPTPLPITAMPVPDSQTFPTTLPLPMPPLTTVPLPVPPLVQTPAAPVSPKPSAASKGASSSAQSSVPPELIETAEAMTKAPDVQIKKKSNIGVGAGAVIGLLIGGPIGAAAGAAAGALLTK